MIPFHWGPCKYKAFRSLPTLTNAKTGPGTAISAMPGPAQLILVCFSVFRPFPAPCLGHRALRQRPFLATASLLHAQRGASRRAAKRLCRTAVSAATKHTGPRAYRAGMRTIKLTVPRPNSGYTLPPQRSVSRATVVRPMPSWACLVE